MEELDAATSLPQAHPGASDMLQHTEAGTYLLRTH